VFKRAARIITPDIARTYTEEVARRKGHPEDSEEYLEALAEARVEIAALGMLDELQPYFDSEADKLTKSWLTKYRVAIKALSDSRQEAYRQVREMSSEPQDLDLVKPSAKDEPTSVLDRDKTVPIPTWRNHLLCDEIGNYPAELNSWERAVVDAESGRAGFCFWYRNPQQPGQSSLGVAYQSDGQYKILRPDFLFFATQRGGSVAVDIVDPHGHHLGDALPKLQGLAKYAATHADVYRRIESVADVDGRLRVLDLVQKDVRDAVDAATDAVSLYRSGLASDYL
jgi:hypothetical protein